MRVHWYTYRRQDFVMSQGASIPRKHRYWYQHWVSVQDQAHVLLLILAKVLRYNSTDTTLQRAEVQPRVQQVHCVWVTHCLLLIDRVPATNLEEVVLVHPKSRTSLKSHLLPNTWNVPQSSSSSSNWRQTLSLFLTAGYKEIEIAEKLLSIMK